MSSFIALFAAIALLLAAAGVVLWRRAQLSAARERVSRVVDQRVAAAGPGAAMNAGMSAPRSATLAAAAMRSGAATSASATAFASASSSNSAAAGIASNRAAVDANRWQARATLAVQHLMSRTGIADVRKPAIVVGLLTCVLMFWAWRLAGPFAVLFVIAAVVCVVAFVLSLRAQRRRARLVAQLPSFLDGIVRLIVLGNSVPAAFQSALLTTEAPLRECLDHVSYMLRTGVEIDRALHQVSLVYRARELELVGAVLRLSVRYGGRADVMLERMATFMRDLEQAQRELSAMSAETRLSAWVLAVLPFLIGGFLIVANPAYFASMWNDTTGRHLVWLALVLQAVGAFMLYRFTRLRSVL